MNYPKRFFLAFTTVLFLHQPVGAEEGAKTLPNHTPGDLAKHVDHGEKTKEFFLNLKPINVPILEGDDTIALAGVTVSFEGKTLGDGIKLNEKETYIRHACLVDLYLIYNLLWSKTNPVSMESVKKRLKQTVEKIVGPGVIDDVLFDNFYVRPRKQIPSG